MSNDSEQLTSADIFGDMLAEVEAEARGSKPAKPAAGTHKPPLADVERKLEETLSGVMPGARGKERQAGRPSEKPRRHRLTLPTDPEIDDLLDETLSSLDIPTRPRKPRKPATEAPSPETPPAVEAPTAELPPAVEPHPSLAAEPEPALESPPVLEPPPRVSGLDDLMPPADQFRTMQLPTFDLGAEVKDGETFGDYTLLDKIATGGMAEVWRARRRGVEGFQKTVAIKKILSHLTGSQDFVTMFIDEAKLAAQLSHNNIIQIYDLGKVGDDYFIAMEHVDGKDLRSILTAAQESSRPVPMGLALLIVSAVARALDYAHRKRDFDGDAMGLVHRDVSPQNVLISNEGAIKLCDFGIVKAVAKASTTQMGALKGKLQYMSPEQAWGKSVDGRSDIFSLGSVLYELFTSTQLFAGESEIGVLDAVRECRIRSPRESVPEIPEEVAGIVLKALAKSPDERYQTAADLEHDLRTALDELRPVPGQKDLATYLRTLVDTPISGAVMIPSAEPAAAAGDESSLTPSPEALAEATPATAAEPDASEASADHTPAAETTPVEATPVEATPAGADESRSGRWKWLAAAVLAGILIGAGWLALSSLTSPMPAPAAASPPPAAAPPPAEQTPATTPSETLPTPPLADEASAPAGETEPGEATSPAAKSAITDGAVEPEPAAQAPEEAGAGQPITAAGIDIEKMVNEELTSRAERLRRDFEAEKKRIEDELARTQAQSPPPSDEQENDGENDAGSGGDG